jgi:DNA-binding NarL/FixJ family response regulator
VSSSVSVAAVKTYLARVFTKLGARDRARLVVVGYEARLVSLPGTSDR